MNIVQSFKQLYNKYPRQYWLMIVGIVLANAGGSMIWPFLVIYARNKLDVPLTAAAALISINAGIGLIASFIAGMVADKVGRKVVMNFSLIVNGIAYFLLMSANTYAEFAGLMVMIGMSNPLYQVGADAMLADLVPSEKRTDAFTLNRIASNAGFAFGPVVGGFLTTRSYDLAFIGAGIGFLTYSLLLIIFARETLQKKQKSESAAVGIRDAFSGYLKVLHDRDFLVFSLTVSIGLVAPMMLWILMPVYSNTNFGIPEDLYGWIPMTNGLMCVFVQYPITSITRRFRTLPVISVGMIFYAIGAGSVALMTSFWGFLLSMVIITFGELTVVPTASKYVADLAPEDLRGRYVSIYWLCWGLARMCAPIIGGRLNDSISPQAIWIGGLLFGLLSTFGLLLLSRAYNARAALPADA